MSFTTLASSATLFPTSGATPNAFSIFSISQSPRETHMMYEDLGQVLRPSNGQRVARKRCNSSPSVVSGLKKIFGM
ncbi:hypothetical protein OBBRIDRAFT_725868 [Obba rivulosa]|uniref:Uncharacterized protein n=1 Tax=Obba rivulosa TaxID=1052685 RepID=A0A8E2B627_9APHY|nr:hypothetical protein OBBRIDRAFT_725868 [Obba rivulosa]